MSTSYDVLLVEDDIVVADVLRRMLVRAGYMVRIANDGNQALAAVSAAPPAVLILDLILPGMSGFTLLEHIQEQSIPIVIITGNPHHNEFLQGGSIRQVLMKPFLFEELLAAVY